MPRRAPSRGWIAVSLASLLGIAACSGGGSSERPNAQLIVDATTHADTARFRTVVQVGAAKGARFTADGAVDFTNQHGDIVETTTLPSSSSSKKLGGPGAAETRWIGGDVYLKGGGLFRSEPRNGWAMVDQAKIRAAAACLVPFDAVAFLSGFGAADPSGVLDSLRKEGKHLTRVGPGTIRGVATVHWHEASSDWPVAHGCQPRPDLVRETVRVGIDVWVDGQNRARRISLDQKQTSTTRDVNDPGDTAPTEPLQTNTQTLAETTDYFDFGAGVRVQAPPAGEVTDETEHVILTSLGPGSVKSSDWQEVAHGAIAAKPWTIYGARTTTGWHCYDAADTPQNQSVILDNGFPAHDGHVSDCTVAGGLFGIQSPASLFVNLTDHGRRVIVGAVEDGRSARLVFNDGTSDPLAIDPSTLVFDYSGPATRAPVRIDVGNESCAVDGRQNVSLPMGFDRPNDFSCSGPSTPPADIRSNAG